MASIDQVSEEIDKLIDARKFDEAYEVAKKNLAKTKCAEHEWRLTQTIYLKVYYASEKPSKEIIRPLFKEALDVIKASHEENPGNPECMTWYGLMLEENASLISLEERSKCMMTIKELWEKSLSLRPDYCLTHSCLGIWYYIMTEQSENDHDFAKKVPPEHSDYSYEKALEHLEYCHKGSATAFPINCIYLAKCYAKLGETEKAKQICSAIVAHPLSFVELDEAKDDATKLLSELK